MAFFSNFLIEILTIFFQKIAKIFKFTLYIYIFLNFFCLINRLQGLFYTFQLFPAICNNEMRVTERNATLKV
jgi:hypothetical protein